VSLYSQILKWRFYFCVLRRQQQMFVMFVTTLRGAYYL